MIVCQRDMLVFGNRCLMEELACKDNKTIAEDDWKEGPCLVGEAKEWKNPAVDKDESGKICVRKYSVIFDSTQLVLMQHTEILCARRRVARAATTLCARPTASRTTTSVTFEPSSARTTSRASG